MRITNLSRFLSLTETELAEVTELVLEDVDLNIKVRNKAIVMTGVDEEGNQIGANTYEVEIQGVTYTIQMDLDADVEYQYLLGIVGNKLSTKCLKLHVLDLKNCSLGACDVETQNFFADLQQCHHLKILSLPGNALWGMTDWNNASDMFGFLPLTYLDLSSNSLFDSDLMDELGDDPADYTAIWSDVLTVLVECKTLQTLNLANNFVENAVGSCFTEITELLTHMIVGSGTEVNLDDNELTYLTSSNLRRLRLTPPASASESPITELSQETIKSQLFELIKKEIEDQDDEINFDLGQFRVVTISSSDAVSPTKSQILKQPSLKCHESLTSLTTIESLSPLEQSTKPDHFSLQTRGSHELSGARIQTRNRRILKVPSRPKSDSSTARLSSLAFSAASSSMASSDFTSENKKRNNSVLTSIDNERVDARSLAKLSKETSFNRQTTRSSAQRLSLSTLAFTLFTAKETAVEQSDNPELSDIISTSSDKKGDCS